MGQLEQEIKNERRKQNFIKIILAVIKTAGLLSIAVVAPNALRILKLFDKGKRNTNPKYLVNRAFNNLLEKGLIRIEQTSKGKFVRLTEGGRRKLMLLGEHSYFVKKPKRWDKKWRIIIFDIKEQKRDIRRKFRQTLKNIGFLQLQKSVWVYPYDCEDLIVLLKADFKIGRDILYIIADKIEADQALRNYFCLN